MLYYHKIDVLEELMLIRQPNQKFFIVFYYCYFLDKGFKFQSYLCDGCHDVLMMPISLSNIAILNIHGALLLAELAKLKP